MRITLGILIALGLTAQPAFASTAAVDDTGVLRFAAAPGERNEIRFSRDDGLVVRDTNPIEAGEGCSNRNPNEVVCTAPQSGSPLDPISCIEPRADCAEGLGAEFRLGDGADTFTTESDNDVPPARVRGEDGADVLEAGPAGRAVWLQGGTEDDELTAASAGGMLDGGMGADRLIGGAGENALRGGSGDDTLLGGDARDTLRGAAGNDYLRGAGELDQFSGGHGADFIKGDGGDDIVTYAGRKGALRITLDNMANDGAPRERDNVQVENVDGGAGGDVIVGNDYENRLVGGGGEDMLIGKGRDDDLRGEGGDDALRGGRGNDLLDLHPREGQADRDVARCGADEDTVSNYDNSDRVSADCEHRVDPR